MNISFKNTFEKISEKTLGTFESSIGHTLPQPYKDFLIKNNGGRISPNSFKTMNNEIETSIQFMFGVTEKTNYDLKDNYENWITRTGERNLIPIGMDSLDNLIVLSLDNNGPVYFWQHDTVLNNSLRLITIADNFETFLNCLFKDKQVKTELDLAINTQNISYFKKRILAGQNINDIKNEFNQSIVTIAALQNKVDLLKYFYQNQADMDLALFYASSNGHYDAVKYLLEIGMNPNERNNEQNNDTPLLQAAFGGYLKIAKELIKFGADFNAQDIHGQSVLRKAYWSNNSNLVKYLEEIGAE